MSGERDDGGPAFPVADFDYHAFRPGNADELKRLLSGMTMRDYFATQAPTDEVQELSFRHLSRDAQEALTGLTYPADNRGPRPTREENVAYQLAEFRFKCAVTAAIRFELADAMLNARQQ